VQVGVGAMLWGESGCVVSLPEMPRVRTQVQEKEVGSDVMGSITKSISLDGKLVEADIPVPMQTFA
jgi:hypothetical protein